MPCLNVNANTRVYLKLCVGTAVPCVQLLRLLLLDSSDAPPWVQRADCQGVVHCWGIKQHL